MASRRSSSRVGSLSIHVQCAPGSHPPSSSLPVLGSSSSATSDLSLQLLEPFSSSINKDAVPSTSNGLDSASQLDQPPLSTIRNCALVHTGSLALPTKLRPNAYAVSSQPAATEMSESAGSFEPWGGSTPPTPQLGLTSSIPTRIVQLSPPHPSRESPPAQGLQFRSTCHRASSCRSMPGNPASLQPPCSSEGQPSSTRDAPAEAGGPPTPPTLDASSSRLQVLTA